MAQYITFGIITGGFLLLATLGFALVSRVEKFMNIAHAELISIGALATWYFQDLGLHFLLAALAAIVVVALIGLLVARVVYDPIIDRGPAILLITSVGVVFVLHGIVEAIVSPGFRTFTLPQFDSWDLGPVRVHPYQLAVLATGLLSLLGLHLFMTKSAIGTSVRALADNRDLANARGVDVRRATRYVWLIASGLAGLAGVALGVTGTITTDIGFAQILLILTVSIVAGLGSIYAVAVAAFVLGLAMDVSVQWIPAGYRSSIAFAAVIIVLLFRPEGIAGQVRSS